LSDSPQQERKELKQVQQEYYKVLYYKDSTCCQLSAQNNW